MTSEQEKLLELLQIFAHICTKYNLQYFLVGGTLLGAVRHKGFIPWDDDIDIAMPEEDFQKFFTLKSEFPANIEVQSIETDPRYPFLFNKLCNTTAPFNTGRCYGPKGIYIDIFPLVSASGSRTAHFLFDTEKIIEYVLQIRTGWSEAVPYKNRFARIGYFILNCFPSWILKKLQKQLTKWIRCNEDSSTLCSLGGAYTAEKEFYPKKWFEKSIPLIFQKEVFQAPIGWHECLTRNYGDYMILPPALERKSRHK